MNERMNEWLNEKRMKSTVRRGVNENVNALYGPEDWPTNRPLTIIFGHTQKKLVTKEAVVNPMTSRNPSSDLCGPKWDVEVPQGIVPAPYLEKNQYICSLYMILFHIFGGLDWISKH